MVNRYNPSKTSVFLMELILGILFFSLSATCCVQFFVRAHTISNSSVVLNHGILWAQNMAEAFYGCNGDTDKMMLLLDSDTNGTQQEEGDSTILSFLYGNDFTPVTLNQSSFPKSGYSLTAAVQPEGDLMTCHILVQEFPLNSETLPIYELYVSLFPKEVP